MPVYNVEKYIVRCMDSVFSQISNDCEVILVDDGSTDNSGEICDQYQTKFPDQCRVFHKENQGAYPTRNFAMDRAKGEYLWFIDPDDYLEKNSIELIKNIVKSNRGIDVITAAYRTFNDSRTGVIENCEKEPHILSGEEFLTEGRFGKAYLWYHIYRHQFLMENNIRFNDELNTQGDWLFNAYAYVAAKRIYLSDELIYNYFQGNPTSTLARRDRSHLLRGVENSMKAELEMASLCEKHKSESIYEPLKKRLSLAVAGFIFSLYRFYIPRAVIKDALNVYQKNGLYPIDKTNNRKANIFRLFANRKWVFITVCSIRNIFRRNES